MWPFRAFNALNEHDSCPISYTPSYYTIGIITWSIGNKIQEITAKLSSAQLPMIVFCFITKVTAEAEPIQLLRNFCHISVI